MQDKIIHENMVGILENITEIISHLSRSSFPYRQLDIDYLMEQIRHLYDEVHQLNKYNQQWLNQQLSNLANDESVQKNQIKQSFTSDQSISTTTHEPIAPEIQSKNVESTSFSATPTTTVIPQNDMVLPPQSISEEGTKTKESSQEAQILAEKYLGRYKAINEHLAKQRQTTESKIDRPIKNLKTEISLNDKFMFIQSIFKNNVGEYERFITHLEDAPNFEHAMEYAKNFLEQKVPNLEESVSSLLFKYIQRRFK
ncbi:MAG: hypothetical protein N2Z72_08140 [Bacteroidales bacterium]|nr:hypothetical protein [Bacteroidales bacterium]